VSEINNNLEQRLYLFSLSEEKSNQPRSNSSVPTPKNSNTFTTDAEFTIQRSKNHKQWLK